MSRLSWVPAAVVAAAVAMVICTTSSFVSAGSSPGSYPAYCGTEDPTPLPPAPPSRPPPRWSSASPLSSTLELKQVQVIMRHGDRTQLAGYTCWPNDIAVWQCNEAEALYNIDGVTSTSTDAPDRLYRLTPLSSREVLKGNCLLAQLTHRGADQVVALGQAFADRYVGKDGLLPTTYDPSYMYFRADTSQRAEQSAVSFINGLYPSVSAAASPAGSSSKIPVIDIFTCDAAYDDIQPNTQVCPVLQEYQYDFFQSPTYKARNASTAEPLVAQLAPLLNKTAFETSLPDLQDCYYTHVCHNQSLPFNVPSQLWQGVLDENLWFANASSSFPSAINYTRAAMGPLIYEMVSNIDAYAQLGASLPRHVRDHPRFKAAPQGTYKKRFVLYSTHDSAMIPLLVGLGVWDNTWPAYASHIDLELYEIKDSAERPRTAARISDDDDGDDDDDDNGEGAGTGAGTGALGKDDTYAVRLIVYGEPVLIPGCSAVLCPISEFAAVATNLIPDPRECVLLGPG